MKCVVGTALVTVICCIATWVVTSAYYEDKKADFSEDIISTEIALLEKAKSIGVPCEKLKSTQGVIVESTAGLVVMWKPIHGSGFLEKLVVDEAFQSANEKVKNECSVQ